MFLQSCFLFLCDLEAFATEMLSDWPQPDVRCRPSESLTRHFHVEDEAGLCGLLNAICVSFRPYVTVHYLPPLIQTGSSMTDSTVLSTQMLSGFLYRAVQHLRTFFWYNLLYICLYVFEIFGRNFELLRILYFNINLKTQQEWYDLECLILFAVMH